MMTPSPDLSCLEVEVICKDKRTKREYVFNNQFGVE